MHEILTSVAGIAPYWSQTADILASAQGAMLGLGGRNMMSTRSHEARPANLADGLERPDKIAHKYRLLH